ncbi:MAG: M50 family metallopeptidase [Tahibacter sp.]
MSGFSDGWRWRELVGLVALGALLLVLGRVPYASMAVYPFRLFGTFVHELSHGMAALATGGHFQRFTVSPDLSGLAWSAGGIRAIVSSAGYVGSAIFGGLLILLGSRGLSARVLLTALGLLLGALCLAFVRNPFGIVTGLMLASAVFLAGRKLREPWSDLLLLILALQLVFDGFNSMLTLFWLSGNSAVQTDALSMQQATGIPAIVWAIVWMLMSAGILVMTLMLAYRGRTRLAQGTAGQVQ